MQINDNLVKFTHKQDILTTLSTLSIYEKFVKKIFSMTRFIKDRGGMLK